MAGVRSVRIRIRVRVRVRVRVRLEVVAAGLRSLRYVYTFI